MNYARIFGEVDETSSRFTDADLEDCIFYDSPDSAYNERFSWLLSEGRLFIQRKKGWDFSCAVKPIHILQMMEDHDSVFHRSKNIRIRGALKLLKSLSSDDLSEWWKRLIDTTIVSRSTYDRRPDIYQLLGIDVWRGVYVKLYNKLEDDYSNENYYLATCTNLGIKMEVYNEDDGDVVNYLNLIGGKLDALIVPNESKCEVDSIVILRNGVRPLAFYTKVELKKSLEKDDELLGTMVFHNLLHYVENMPKLPLVDVHMIIYHWGEGEVAKLDYEDNNLVWLISKESDQMK